MKRAEILDSAKEIVTKDREEQYGSPEDNFATIAEFWTTYIKTKCVGPGTDVNISPADVGTMMILLKTARIAGGSEKSDYFDRIINKIKSMPDEQIEEMLIKAGIEKADNFIDIVGYAACAGELVSKKNE